MINGWIILVMAGICEIIWALGLKYSDGLSKPLYSFITVAFMIASFYLLAMASRQIPIGISYVVWVGIGAIGTLVGSVLLFEEKSNLTQILFCVTLIMSVLGIKISTLKL